MQHVPGLERMPRLHADRADLWWVLVRVVSNEK